MGPRDFIAMISYLGFIAELLSVASKMKAEDHTLRNKWRRLFCISLVFTLPLVGIMLYQAIANPKNAEVWINAAMGGLATPVLFVVGRPIFISGWKSVRHGAANMDALIGLGTGVAYVYSLIAFVAILDLKRTLPDLYFDAVPMLFTFVTLGRYLVHVAKGRTSEALHKLMSLQPMTAILLKLDEHGKVLSEETIDIDLVQQNDVLKVIPNVNVPVDGDVIYGTSHVDEAMLTGESIPQVKDVGSPVFGGTANGPGWDSTY